MCGRYTLRSKPMAIAEEFDLPEVPPLHPRFNIAPNQPVAVVRFDPSEGSRRLDFLTWGLVPSWANDPSIGDHMINARSESVLEKPAFRYAFRSRRCFVVADGFYEWQRQDGWKRPFFVHRRDDIPFAFAGLWEHWEKGYQPIHSCTLLTTDANEVLAPIHDRMPVIVPRSAYDLWLDPAVKDPDRLQPLLVPFPIDEMEAYPVSRLVNDPGNDVPECIQSIETEDWLPGLSS
ncbi:MAG: SOS response-associated peptidase [Isosphaeraceae bacterium]